MEKSKKVYIDANIFLSANNPFESEHNNAVLLFQKIDQCLFSACTSALTIDEVVFISQKIMGRSNALELGNTILEHSGIEIIPATRELLHAALHLMAETALQPRDAIHLASAFVGHADSFVTLDKDFDKIRDITIVSLKEALRMILP